MRNPLSEVKDLTKVTNVRELTGYMNTLNNEGRAAIINALGEKLTQAQKSRVLMIIQSDVSKADKEVREWLVKGISKSYVVGMNWSSTQLRALHFKPTNGKAVLNVTVEMLNSQAVLQPHLKAVNSLLSDAYLDFGGAMTGYIKGAERIISTAMRKQLRSEIAIGRLEGSSIQDIKKVVKETFSDRGFTVLLDRGGNKWSLSNYSEMLARTHINRANNEGTINRASDYNVDIVEVSAHGASDILCSRQEGQIYSVSGKSKDYPALSGNTPPYHPNCTHNLLLRPDLL